MSASPWVRVLALAGLLGLNSATASAADLYSENGPSPRFGTAYDDPRYADLYGTRPPVPQGQYRRYEQGPPLPPERVYRDDRGSTEGRYARGCPSKEEISQHLERDGWSGFTNPQIIDRHIATIDARRPNGRPYRLEVDRCTGEILALRPIDGPRYGHVEPGYPPYQTYPADPRRYPPRAY